MDTYEQYKEMLRKKNEQSYNNKYYPQGRDELLDQPMPEGYESNPDPLAIPEQYSKFMKLGAVQKDGKAPIPSDMPDKVMLDYRQRAYEAAKAREAANNRPQEGGTVMADQNIRTQGIKNAMDEKNMRWQAVEQMMNEMNKDVPFMRQPENLRNANFKKDTRFADIPDPSVQPPVKVHKKFLK